MLESENIKQSIAQSFFENLEFHLSGALKNSADKALRWFWCDGIMPPEDMTQLCPENLRKTQRIITKACIGQSGQDIYDLYINLGPIALQNCIEQPDWNDCLPSNDSTDWFTISSEERWIELCLK